MNAKRTLRVGLLLIMLPLAGCTMSEGQMGKVVARMRRAAPKVGEEAPDFALKTRDGSDTVRLSEFEGDRPVVLIFGSWT